MKSRPEILVIDDQEAFDMMQPVLNDLLDNPSLVHCRNRNEALDYVASNRFADFIFADWDLTGYAFMNSVRRDLENHNTPVIIMSEDTTNKKIALNSLTREATFFLAKPFLPKGLIKKFDKAMKVVERRRKNRIHPPVPYRLPIAFDDGIRETLPLVDVSIDGCLFRAPIEFGQRIRIYQRASLSLRIDEFDIEADGEVYRIGHDRPIPEHRDTILIMIKFTGEERQQREIQELVDELAKRW